MNNNNGHENGNGNRRREDRELGMLIQKVDDLRDQIGDWGEVKTKVLLAIENKLDKSTFLDFLFKRFYPLLICFVVAGLIFLLHIFTEKEVIAMLLGR